MSGNRTRSALLVLATLAGSVGPLSAQPALYTLKDNATGGDCRARNIGLWNAATKTCRLIRNLRASIEIADDGVKLFGNLRTLRPPAQALPFGVLAQNRRDVVISGVRIDGFGQGVSIDGGGDNTVTKNIITNAARLPGGIGISLSRSDWNTLNANLITDLQGQGIRVDGGSNNRVLNNRLRENVLQLYMARSNLNLVDGNTFTGNPNLFTDAIVMDHADDNMVSGNTLTGHGGAAVTLDVSDRNTFIFNGFTNNGLPSAFFLRSGTGNQGICNDFNANMLAVQLNPQSNATLVVLNNFYGTDTAQDLAVPVVNQFDNGVMGNHWTINAPACVDVNADGICDAPYVFVGNQDNRPLVRPVPWRVDPAACYRGAPPGEESAAIGVRLAASEWARAVANGNTTEILRRLGSNVELTTRDGRLIRGAQAVADSLKSAFAGTLFVADAIEAGTPPVVVRARAYARARGAAAPVNAALELMPSRDGRWRVVRIRISGQ